MKRLLVLMFYILVCFSCQQKVNDITPISQYETINFRINFDENIHSFNPYEATSQSELFVRDLVFDPLFYDDRGELRSKLISKHYYDEFTKRLSTYSIPYP